MMMWPVTSLLAHLWHPKRANERQLPTNTVGRRARLDDGSGAFLPVAVACNERPVRVGFPRWGARAVRSGIGADLPLGGRSTNAEDCPKADEYRQPLTTKTSSSTRRAPSHRLRLRVPGDDARLGVGILPTPCDASRVRAAGCRYWRG